MKISADGLGQAFTLVELLAIVVIVMAIATVLLPRLARAKCHCGQHANCVNNLKQIGVAVRTWALDNGDKYPTHVSVSKGGAMESLTKGMALPFFEVMSNELSTPKILICPKESDAYRVAATTFSSVVPPASSGQIPFTNGNNLSYFVGIDAVEEPPQSVLCGDDNFALDGLRLRHRLIRAWRGSSVQWTKTRHIDQGNLLFADGSVVQANNGMLVVALGATNRFAMP
jgi:prepilin-type processing-associated H-X9-DG protein